MQVALQDFEDQCNETVASLEDPEYEKEIIHAASTSRSFLRLFSSSCVIPEALPTKCEIKKFNFSNFEE